MTDFTIAAAILLLGFGALLYCTKSGTEKKDERDPEAPRNPERQRATSEAAAAAPAHQPLSEKDAATVAELHEYFQEIGTGEHPVVAAHPVRRRHVYREPSARQMAEMRARALAPVRAFEADPLAAPLPEALPVAPPVLFDGAVHFFFAESFTAPPALELESFTQGWNRADIERMVAEAKAGIRR